MSYTAQMAGIAGLTNEMGITKEIDQPDAEAMKRKELQLESLDLLLKSGKGVSDVMKKAAESNYGSKMLPSGQRMYTKKKIEGNLGEKMVGLIKKDIFPTAESYELSAPAKSYYMEKGNSLLNEGGVSESLDHLEGLPTKSLSTGKAIGVAGVGISAVSTAKTMTKGVNEFGSQSAKNKAVGLGVADTAMGAMALSPDPIFGTLGKAYGALRFATSLWS